jgi:hypothetical protein
MAWKDLFSTDYGLMSLAVIVIVIGIAVFLYRKFTRLMAEEPDQKG